MSVTQTEQRGNTYALGHTPEEYDRLRAQARMWDAAAGRLFDQAGLAPGASCLDAGCGPGETMRAMAERVGPTGRVLGIDRDASLGALAVEMLHGEGHRQCSFREHDLSQAAAVPGGPFDLIYARLLLFHLPQRVEALSRLWDAVAPGGHLIVQDYDFRSIGVAAGPRQHRRTDPRVHRCVHRGGRRRARGHPPARAFPAGRDRGA